MWTKKINEHIYIYEKIYEQINEHIYVKKLYEQIYIDNLWIYIFLGLKL